MATVDFVNRAEDFSADLIAEYPGSDTAAADRSDLKVTRRLLRDALAREAALRQERDQLLERQATVPRLFASGDDAANRLAGLSPKQRNIMDYILAGHPNKNIAADMGLSRRTVEAHRASIMKKTGAKCLAELVRLALTADRQDENASQSVR